LESSRSNLSAAGPLLVGVADDPGAIVACAELPKPDRIADVIEARIDLFPHQSIDACAAACACLEATGTAVLATIRSAGQGGRFAGDESDRLQRYRAALAVASWVDVEDDAEIVGEVAALATAKNAVLVVSHHDFGRTPGLPELLRLIDACHAVAPGAVAKLATAVATEADRAALRGALAARAGRTCVIGMSPDDDDFRVELAAAGSLMSYGYLRAPTAPGQLSAAALDLRLLAASPRYADRRRAAGYRR
jgi:3-dehydroquinate dehydratase I